MAALLLSATTAFVSKPVTKPQLRPARQPARLCHSSKKLKLEFCERGHGVKRPGSHCAPTASGSAHSAAQRGHEEITNGDRHALGRRQALAQGRP